MSFFPIPQHPPIAPQPTPIHLSVVYQLAQWPPVPPPASVTSPFFPRKSSDPSHHARNAQPIPPLLPSISSHTKTKSKPTCLKQNNNNKCIIIIQASQALHALIQHYRLFYNCVSYTFPFLLLRRVLGVRVWRFFLAGVDGALGEFGRTLTGPTTDQIRIMWSALTSRLGHLLVFSFFFNDRAIMEVIFFPFHCPTFFFWLRTLGWGPCSSDDIHFPPSSSRTFLSIHSIDHISSRPDHTHASIHAHALVPSIHPTTHFLEVYILGRSLVPFHPVFSSNSFFGFSYFCD